MTTQTVQALQQKYKWDWDTKLNESPFRREIKRLKEENKKNPSLKASNNEFKRLLKAKEKELLREFQQKCDQSKIWIDNAHKEYNNENGTNDSESLAQYKRKKEKIESIDQFWDELICKQTVFVQQKKIETQKRQMQTLEKQTKELQNQLSALNKLKTQSVSGSNSAKKKKKKKVKKDKYKGLIGYYNKPQKKKAKKVKNVELKKENKPIPKPIPKPMGKPTQKPMKTPIQKPMGKPTKQSMKKGFLNSANPGLYSDKKLDSELTVPERNAKNRKQIEEMGLKEATDNPQYTWERPKEGSSDKAADPLTAFLNQTHKDGLDQK